MSTLLLRLAGPMQSWGTQSRFTVRDTGLEPSKSGVIGLLCAALGRDREESVNDLARLRLGVRVDSEGKMAVDYHTVGGSRHDGYGVATVSGKPTVVLSNRYFLTGANFLVGLEGDEGLLRELFAALQEPRWALFLGRKSFVPGIPVDIPDGLRIGENLDAALRKYPWDQSGRETPDRLRFVFEIGYDEISGDHQENVRQDQPVGAAFSSRQFARRYVRTEYHAPPGDAAASENTAVAVSEQTAVAPIHDAKEVS